MDVLHALVLLGHGAPADMARLAGADEPPVARELERLAVSGLAAEVSGALTGWVATPSGRQEHRRRLAAELDASGGRDKVQDAYERFLHLNRPFLEACSDWQLDPGDGTEVIARLHGLHRRLSPVLADLEAALSRFDVYRPRFVIALARLDTGERDWFTKPGIDSYHTVWFQLHEDLLATLDRDRSQEELTEP